jgi:hypothetical protein
MAAVRKISMIMFLNSKRHNFRDLHQQSQQRQMDGRMVIGIERVKEKKTKLYKIGASLLVGGMRGEGLGME